jgi:hypothetical protein
VLRPIEETPMGLMDKAKKLADQAQHKLDEAQESFNQRSAPQQEPQPGGVRYDEHGRPLPREEKPPDAAAEAERSDTRPA